MTGQPDPDGGLWKACLHRDEPEGIRRERWRLARAIVRARVSADIEVLTPKGEAWPKRWPDDVTVRPACERLAVARVLLEG